MTKKWFEDWSIVTRNKEQVGETFKVLEIDLPNGAGKKEYRFEEMHTLTEEDIEELASILMSAFDQIQRDNGGFKKS